MKRSFLALGVLALATFSVADDVAYNSANATTNLKVGDTISFTLDALPSAGYTWQPTTTGRDNLKFVLSKSLPAANGMPGAKQKMLLRFLATAPGAATVTLQYGRVWEIKKGGKPDKTIAAKVLVK